MILYGGYFVIFIVFRSIPIVSVSFLEYYSHLSGLSFSTLDLGLGLMIRRRHSFLIAPHQ